tara:strand:+ start:204 stop:383 length:180 start_codon:yes stop_codon:yes gene_type:complete
MALSKELTDTVKQVIKDLELDQQFEQIFLKHLEKESNFQADEEERLGTINLLRSQMNKK